MAEPMSDVCKRCGASDPNGWGHAPWCGVYGPLQEIGPEELAAFGAEFERCCQENDSAGMDRLLGVDP